MRQWALSFAYLLRILFASRTATVRRVRGMVQTQLVSKFLPNGVYQPCNEGVHCRAYRIAPISPVPVILGFASIGDKGRTDRSPKASLIC